ncbi:endonuclease/exonuclease/phosphatase family protein [Jiangella mangrovi]|uniref:Endonuclease/exonuclease/phosphatase family metal-dependent hydrolase n=1 Tax=Jiangella mangrovi TaxID=1524084 RepID=A0A7W9GU55_9ACTN|nr:endonuclease/exonuclease/phosphatase family protein [Jiangella mangrovi]MBB5790069.1 endonuclease/exonuclease/phosphatase family metal-dependent hydrolase [Jiangella mangrovi]
MAATRVLHWNIHSWRDEDGDRPGGPNADAVAAVIAETDPQIVSLVEVDERWGAVESLAGLASRFGFSWVFPPTVHYGDDDGPRGGYGNALLVKARILAVQQWQLRWPPRPYDGSESSEARSVLLVKLGIGPDGLWVGSTHLPRRSAPARSAGLGRLLELVGGLDAPWLICGDFNTAASSWVPADGSVLVRPSAPEPSYPASAPTEPIDYVVAAPGLTVSAAVLDRPGSDHLPLRATVTVGEGAS